MFPKGPHLSPNQGESVTALGPGQSIKPIRGPPTIKPGGTHYFQQEPGQREPIPEEAKRFRAPDANMKAGTTGGIPLAFSQSWCAGGACWFQKEVTSWNKRVRSPMPAGLPGSSVDETRRGYCVKLGLNLQLKAKRGVRVSHII